MSRVIDNGSPCVHVTGIGKHVPPSTTADMKETQDNYDESPNGVPDSGEKETKEYLNEVNGNTSITETSEGSPLERNGETAMDDTSKGAPEGWVSSAYASFMEEIVKLKWRVLIVVLCIPLGDYYIYDFPSSLGVGKVGTIQSRFFDQDEVYTQQMNQALYSVYSYPNVLLSILGGILVDSVLGLRVSVLLFSSCILLGSFVFYLGVQFISYELLLIGRLIFSLGGECLCVAQNAYLARWFKGGHGTAFAFAVTIAVLRAAASANFYFSPRFAESHGVAFAALAGTFLCAFSTCSCVVLVFVDRYAEKKNILLPQELGDTRTDEITNEKTRVAVIDRMKTVLFQIRTLPPQHWLICAVCVFLYGSNFPFIGFAKNFFEAKYALSSEEAGGVLSVYQITAAVGCIVAGLICNRTGRGSYVMAITSVSFVLIHLIMIFTFIPPIAAMVIFGIFYSFLVASLWPSVVYVVSQRVTGVSFGVLMSVQAIGSATIPLIVGAILDANLEETNKGANIDTTITVVSNVTDSPSGPRQATLIGYYYVEAVMIFFAIVSLIFSIVMVLVDTKMSGGIICMGAKQQSHIMGLRMEHPNKELNCNEFHRANIQ